MKTKIQQVDVVTLTVLKTNPPQLLITASGMASTSGWSAAELRPMRGNAGGQTLFYEFIAEPRQGPGADVLTPITAHAILHIIPADLKKIVVVAATNKQEASHAQPHMPELYDVHLGLGRLRSATGVSKNLSFDEAFRDALKKLPPEEPVGTDQLTTVRVVRTYALFGGFAGFHELHVVVEAF